MDEKAKLEEFMTSCDKCGAEALRWKQVAEKPDGKSDVLIFVLDDYEGNTNYITVDCPPFTWNEEVTHWMPLPKPPV